MYPESEFYLQILCGKPAGQTIPHLSIEIHRKDEVETPWVAVGWK